MVDGSRQYIDPRRFRTTAQEQLRRKSQQELRLEKYGTYKHYERGIEAARRYRGWVERKTTRRDSRGGALVRFGRGVAMAPAGLIEYGAVIPPAFERAAREPRKTAEQTIPGLSASFKGAKEEFEKRPYEFGGELAGQALLTYGLERAVVRPRIPTKVPRVKPFKKGPGFKPSYRRVVPHKKKITPKLKTGDMIKPGRKPSKISKQQAQYTKQTKLAEQKFKERHKALQAKYRKIDRIEKPQPVTTKKPYKKMKPMEFDLPETRKVVGKVDIETRKPTITKKPKPEYYKTPEYLEHQRIQSAAIKEVRGATIARQKQAFDLGASMERSMQKFEKSFERRLAKQMDPLLGDPRFLRAKKPYVYRKGTIKRAPSPPTKKYKPPKMYTEEVPTTKKITEFGIYERVVQKPEPTVPPSKLKQLKILSKELAEEIEVSPKGPERVKMKAKLRKIERELKLGTGEYVERKMPGRAQQQVQLVKVEPKVKVRKLTPIQVEKQVTKAVVGVMPAPTKIKPRAKVVPTVLYAQKTRIEMEKAQKQHTKTRTKMSVVQKKEVGKVIGQQKKQMKKQEKAMAIMVGQSIQQMKKQEKKQSSRQVKRRMEKQIPKQIPKEIKKFKASTVYKRPQPLSGPKLKKKYEEDLRKYKEELKKYKQEAWIEKRKIPTLEELLGK